ncbi:MAG TPA: hypothetical protein VF941_09745 [Clostridia bacterium]
MKTSYVRIFNNVFLCAAYIISLYCFTGTSTYGFFVSSLGSDAFALLVVNILTAAFITLRMSLGKGIFQSMGTFSFALLFFCIIPVSKLDWFKTLTGIRIESRAHVGLVAMASFMALLGVILSGMLKRLDDNIAELLKRGASPVEVRDVEDKQVRVWGYVFSGLLLPGLLAIMIGFFVMSDQKGEHEPFIFLLAGVAIALLLVFFFLSSYKRK